MGVLLLVVGLAALGFGLMQHLKEKKILAAPFKKTGEIARNPVSSDPKGMMSTEGNVVPPATAILSPLSKTPCLYYEVAISRKWEKTEQTQDGAKTTKGSTNVDTLKGGAEFGLDDGTGPVMVDASKGGDFDNLKKQGEAGGVTMSDGYVKFGELRIPKPIHVGDDYTLGYEAVEKIVPVGGSLFALGKLEGGKLSKPGWRSMMFSTKGRDGLLASTAKKKKFSFIGGGIGAVAAIPLMIFGPKSAPGVDTHCHNQLASAIQTKCNDNTATGGGEDYAWNVEKAATYHVKLMPPAGKKFPMIPVITITNEKGDVVGTANGSPGESISVDQEFQPGKYTINMKSTATASAKVKGGYDFFMEISGDGVAAPAPAGEAVAAADGKPAEEGAPAAGGVAVKSLDKLGLKITVPADITFEDSSMDSPAMTAVSNSEFSLSVVQADTGVYAETMEAQKKELALDPNKVKKFTKAEKLQGGWVLEWEAEDFMEHKPLYGVNVQKTIGGKPYQCARNTPTKSVADAISAACQSLVSAVDAPIAAGKQKNVASAAKPGKAAKSGKKK